MSEIILTDANFKKEVLESAMPVLVDFWAEWCGPCRMLAPVIEKVAKEYSGKIKVGKVNVDDNPETPQQYGIQGIPTIILFKGGKAEKQMVGFQPEDAIKSAIDNVL